LRTAPTNGIGVRGTNRDTPSILLTQAETATFSVYNDSCPTPEQAHIDARRNTDGKKSIDQRVGAIDAEHRRGLVNLEVV
jgi:hypothetical protein